MLSPMVGILPPLPRDLLSCVDRPCTVDRVSGFVEENDREWLCPIGVGTPAQMVNLDLDTGSADL